MRLRRPIRPSEGHEMKQLIHNGVMQPPAYEVKSLKVKFKGKPLKLTPLQEEMLFKWCQKIGTPYVEDLTFIRNFFADFAKALELDEKIGPEDFDFSDIIAYIEKERAKKQSMTYAERKKLAVERKAVREANKAKYGYAFVDGQKVELSNYMMEPAAIFIGRGKHPLRGRWKAAAGIEAVTLNLSPDAPRPPGNWKEIVWRPNEMWIAKWDDPLRGVEKYVWFHESSTIKQNREREKLELAKKLERNINKVRRYIEGNLIAQDEKRRKIATVAYLIDALKIRVGDEKDVKEEADTVGATTLRPKHIKFNSDGTVHFDFLGKDSVRFKRSVELPLPVISNLKAFVKNTQSEIFSGISSDHVREFLSEAMPGLSPKVFRTYYSTKIVREYLHKNRVDPEAPEELKKRIATLANLQAAILCNHQKKTPKNWEKTYQKRLERLRSLKGKRTKHAAETRRTSKIKLELMRTTRQWNLGTSLKNYISPTVFKEWGEKMKFDWKKYYPKGLQKKFSWLDTPQNV